MRSGVEVPELPEREDGIAGATLLVEEVSDDG